MSKVTLDDLKGRKAQARRKAKLIGFLSQPTLLEEAGPPRILLHLLFTASLMIGGFLVWAAITEIKETALAQGQVMPAGSVHSVQHLEGGIVSEILAVEGSVVEEGQVLMLLSPTAAQSDLEQLRVREIGLALQAERLRAFVLGHTPDFSIGRMNPALVRDQRTILNTQIQARDSQSSVLLARIEQRKAELASLAARRENFEGQAAIIREQLEMRGQLLEKGLVSRVVYLETQRALTETLGELSETEGRISEIEEALVEAQRTLVELDAQLDNEALKEMGEINTELAEVREQMERLEDRVSRLAVLSPSRGVIKGLNVHTIGAVVAPGDVLLEVVPIDDEMVAEVQIEPRDIGHIQIGQAARVKVTTYDTARHGVIEGRLDRISASTFEDEQGEVFYRATIVLDKNYVGNQPDRNLVLPGMLVDADIRTGGKSLLRYLFKPVYRSLDSAFSER